MMLLLFNSLVRSRLEYCCEIWDPYTITNINKVEQIQKRFTNKINGMKQLDYWERLVEIDRSCSLLFTALKTHVIFITYFFPYFEI